MPISIDLVKQVLDASLSDFFKEESAGLAVDISERNSCGRLAHYLERHAHEAGLGDYRADVEYNRKQGGQIKTIVGKRSKVITISADLILHSRGRYVENDNLIAVEMKKSARPIREKNADRERLRAMTRSSFDGVWSNDGTTHPEHVCGYLLGVFIEIGVGSRTAQVEYYKRGRRTKTVSWNF